MLLKQQRELMATGLVTKDQMTAAMQSDAGKKGDILLALLEMNSVDSAALLAALASMFKVPYLDIGACQPTAEALKLCDEKLCLDFAFIPLEIQGDDLVIATDNPVDYNMLDHLRFKLGKRIKPIFARPDFIARKIREVFQGDAAVNAAMRALEDSGGFEPEREPAKPRQQTVNPDELRRGAEDSSIIKLVNGIIIQAMKIGSSDVHIDPGEKQSTVRLIVNGELRPNLKFPANVHQSVAARIKMMSGLDLSNLSSQQDGRTRIKLWGKSYDMRVSTLPATQGERIVLRILNKGGVPHDVIHQSAEVPPQKLKNTPAVQRHGDGKKVILVVDDSASIRNLVKFVLESNGYDTLQAEDGLEAWNMVQSLKPDMVIADCDMPNMTGPELVRRMREQQQFNNTPIVLLTGQKNEEDEVLGLEVGADDYIGKPVEPLKLQARVKKTLAMYARIRQAAQGE